MKIKLMPAVMTVLSAFYFIYVLTSKDTTLVADAVGGDPGGKVLPMMMAVFMFFGFFYITLKEHSDKKPMDKETKKLFIVTLVSTVLYVLLIKYLGFVISSTILVYTLEYLFATSGEKQNGKIATIVGVGVVAISSAVYMLMRLITKTGLSMGKNGVLPAIFASSAFEACISLILLGILTIVLQGTLGRWFREKNCYSMYHAAIVTFAAVLILYVIFRQFFNVNLAPGLLNY